MLNLYTDSKEVGETFDALPIGTTFLFMRVGGEQAWATKINSVYVQFTPISGNWVHKWDFRYYVGVSSHFEVDFSMVKNMPEDVTKGTPVEQKIKMLDYKFKNKLLRKVNVVALPLGA